MTDRIRLLVVEDNIALAENLFEFFSDERYILDFAANGLTALHLIATNQYDVIALDVMLPGLCGFELCQKIRHELRCSTPIILMTAKDRIDDKETGFGQGADDYLVKPFQLRELQLRIDALYSRRIVVKTAILRAGDVEFNPGTLKVSVNGATGLELSGTAARIFEALIKQHPNMLSYEELQKLLWGGREIDIHTLRTHVYTLRKQLAECFGLPLIKTIHSRGYRLIPPGEE